MSDELVLNIPLLRLIQNEIKAEPALFNMSRWFQDSSFYTDRMYSYASTPIGLRGRTLQARNVCGTVCCIAGHAVRLSSTQIGDRFPDESNEWDKIGAKLLGLSSSRTIRLFYVTNWPHPWRDRFASTDDLDSEAEIAIDLIEAIIESNGTVLDD